jgi:thioesterase domain-containing protein
MGDEPAEGESVDFVARDYPILASQSLCESPGLVAPLARSHLETPGQASTPAPAATPTPSPEYVINELERTLHTELPVTQHLGIRVVAASLERVELTAPLAANHNHRGTAFAGSLNSLATLAGWSWMWLLLRRHGLQAQVIIQDSTISYDRPVTGDFAATCAGTDPAAAARFLGGLARRGRSRLKLTVEVRDQQGPAVSFTGRFVAVSAKFSADE